MMDDKVLPERLQLLQLLQSYRHALYQKVEGYEVGPFKVGFSTVFGFVRPGKGKSRCRTLLPGKFRTPGRTQLHRLPSINPAKATMSQAVSDRSSKERRTEVVTAFGTPASAASTSPKVSVRTSRWCRGYA